MPLTHLTRLENIVDKNTTGFTLPYSIYRIAILCSITKVRIYTWLSKSLPANPSVQIPPCKSLPEYSYSVHLTHYTFHVPPTHLRISSAEFTSRPSNRTHPMIMYTVSGKNKHYTVEFTGVCKMNDLILDEGFSW